MKKLHKLLVGLLFTLFFGFATNHVVAADVYDYSEAIYYNPLYVDVYDQLPELPEPKDNLSLLADPVYETDLDVVIKQIQDGMIARKSNFVVYYETTEFLSAQDICSNWWPLIAEETDNPSGGDYLYWHCVAYGISNIRRWNPYTECYDYEITYMVDYYTTAEQEAAMDAEVESLINKLNITDSMSQYEKIETVYEYMCKNIVYDYDHLIDETYSLKYTAYAALINKTSVCQGYATALYKILETMGIDTRVITGIGNGGYHAWNIIRINDTYYLADATWDASWVQAGFPYEFFLQGTETFEDHYAESEFLGEYNVSPEPYINGTNTNIAEGSCGPTAYWYITKAGELVIHGTGAISDNTGYSAYKDEIKTLKIEEGITEIGKEAFAFMNDLGGELVLPDSINTIGEAAFWGCVNLTGTLIIPENVTEISDFAFGGCQKLEIDGNAIIHDNITRIGEQAFFFCQNFTGDLLIGKNVTEIGKSAFASCQNLNGSLIIGENVKIIGESAFSGCGFKNGELVISEGVETIGASAFRNCDFTGTVVIPDSVTSIGAAAFAYCQKLTGIVFGKGIELIPRSLFESCSSLNGPLILPEGITAVGRDAFKYCSNLTGDVVIPDSVTSIGSYAFFSCSNLSGDLVIGDGVTRIEEYAFMGCSEMRGTLTLGTSLEEIGDCAFSGCLRLQGEVVFPENVRLIGDDAFKYCDFSKFIIMNPDCEIVVRTASAGTTIPKSIILSSYADSGIETFAKENGYTFEVYCQHEWSDEYTIDKDAACEEEGSKSIRCVKCNGVKDGSETLIEAAGHTWSEWRVTKAATCEDDGVEVRGCKNCEEAETRIVKAWGHYSELKDVKDATCTVDGYTGDMVCTKCNEVIEKGEVIKAAGHNWSTWMIVKEPTYDEEGMEERTCQNCSDKESHVLPKLEKEEIKNPFTDVAEDEYFFDPVMWAYSNKVTTGTSATEFSPDAECTRAQIVTFLWRAMGCPEPESTSHPFNDVDVNDYYGKAVLWAVEKGITNGTSKTQFSPDAECTRAQIVTFLWRTMGCEEPTSKENPFKDVKVSEYYGTAVMWAVENGITTGTGSGVFSPDATCTRGQVVTFLYRAVV